MVPAHTGVEVCGCVDEGIVTVGSGHQGVPQREVADGPRHRPDVPVAARNPRPHAGHRDTSVSRRERHDAGLRRRPAHGGVASAVGTRPPKIGDPRWVSTPAVSIESFTVNGTPCAVGPSRRRPRSPRQPRVRSRRVGQCDNGVDRRVHRLDPVEVGLHDLHRRHLPRADQRCEVGGVAVDQVVVHEAPFGSGRALRDVL